MRKRRRPSRFRRWFLTYGFTVMSYGAFGAAGILAFSAPSPTLRTQGGVLILYAWAVVCLLGSMAALVGVFLHVKVAKLLGAALCATASLVWCVALVAQTVKTGNLAALSASCLVGALAGLLAQHWVDAGRPPDE